MTADELTAPLGAPPPPPPAPARPRRRWLAPVLGGAGVLVVAGVGTWLALMGDPLGGEPVAVATIAPAPPPPAKSLATPPATPVETQAPARPGTQTAGGVEAESGVVVVRGGSGTAPAAIIVRTPDAPRTGPSEPDPALMERGREGMLPRIGADGRRPSEAYARPSPPGAPGTPRIAILVGGLGLSRTGTQAAIEGLPPDVTLAFAPYGSGLDAWAARARTAGHETMLQAPMEPFDYPDNDPGPQTLLAAATPAQNLERLHWQMERFAGYVGIANYMGGRFTSTPAAFTPVLREVAARGLIYADDGSSARSLAATLGREAGLDAPVADVVIDTDPSPAAIDGALARLEATAKAHGTAFGVGTALPVTLAHLKDWAGHLEARGIRLVPVSALAADGPTGSVHRPAGTAAGDTSAGSDAITITDVP